MFIESYKKSKMNICCFPILTIKITQKMVMVLKQLANLAALTKDGKYVKSETCLQYLPFAGKPVIFKKFSVI